jgi:rhodanese-related sulfurtransferase
MKMPCLKVFVSSVFESRLPNDLFNQRGILEMLKRLIVLTMLSTASFAQEGAPPVHHESAPTRAKKLTNAELDQYLAHPEKVLLIDVRRPDEISTIGGFPVYLNIQIKDLKNHLGEIPKGRQIITVSNHAARAALAADLLEDNGFTVLGAVGADTYQKDGGTLAVKFPIPPPHATAAGEPEPAGGHPAAVGASSPQ